MANCPAVRQVQRKTHKALGEAGVLASFCDVASSTAPPAEWDEAWR